MAKPAAAQKDGPGAEIGEVGQRIRYLRKLKRMRLKDLAEAAGCSESLLSKVELNRATPSLRMLHRIMAELDSNIGALFAQTPADEVLVYHDGERPVVRVAAAGDDAGIRLERLAPVHESRILDGNIHVVDPGANNGGEIKHEGEEIGYLLSGELELTVAERTFHLREGASFHFRSDLPHSYRNPGATIAKVLWINSPPTF